jgi:hypothetical protein
MEDNKKQDEVLTEFEKCLTEKQKDIPKDFADILNQKFMELF